MIITNIKPKKEQGYKHNNIKSAIKYLLDKVDRKTEARILDGSRERTIEIDKNYCKYKFEHHYTSGVLSFAKGEILTDRQKFEVIEKFKDTFLGNMKDRVNCLFVEHTDKDRLEIHYLINKADILTGKSFNAFWPGDQTRRLMKTFADDINKEYGFNEVVQKLTTKTKSKFEGSIKSKVDNYCKRLVKLGIVNNREQLINHLEKEGYKFNRVSNDYISIIADGKNIRLKDGIYSNETNYKNVVVTDNKTDLVKEVMSRNNYNSIRYNAEYKGVSKTAQVEKSAPKTVAPTSNNPKTHHEPIDRILEDLGKKDTFTPGTATPGTTEKAKEMGGTPTASGGGAFMRVSAAQAKIANARNKAEEMQALFECAQALKALEQEQQQEEEQRKRRINRI